MPVEAARQFVRRAAPSTVSIGLKNTSTRMPDSILLPSGAAGSSTSPSAGSTTADAPATPVDWQGGSARGGLCFAHQAGRPEAGGSAEGWLCQYGGLGATAFRSGASLGGPTFDGVHSEGGGIRNGPGPFFVANFGSADPKRCLDEANHCPSKTDCNTRDTLFAGCAVSSLTAADLRRS